VSCYYRSQSLPVEWFSCMATGAGLLCEGRGGLAPVGKVNTMAGLLSISVNKETSYPTKRRCEVCQEMRLIVAKIGPLSIKGPCPNQCGRGRDVTVRLTGVESKTAVGNVVPVRN